MTWSDQMRALVIFPESCGTNPGWSDLIWYTDTPAPGLLKVSFLMYLYLFPFVRHFLILAVTNMHDLQRVTSYLKSRNIDGRAPGFASLNMDLVWSWYHLSFHDLNSCYKGDNTSGNMMISICYCVIFCISFI